MKPTTQLKGVISDITEEQGRSSKYAKFNVSIKYNNKGTEEIATYSLVAFRKTAEVVTRIQSRSFVIIDATVSSNEYNGKNYTNLIANRVYQVSSQANTQQQPPQQASQPAPQGESIPNSFDAPPEDSPFPSF